MSLQVSSFDARRTRILAACARCIARKGIRGLRMGDVAREAEVSTGLLYYHFNDRNGLLAATLAYVNDSAARPGERGAASPTRAGLIDNLVAELEDTLENRDHATAWHEISASALFDTATAGHLAASDADWQRRIAHALVVQGCPPATADTLSLTAVALVDGLIARWLSGRISGERARATLRDTLDSLFPSEIPTSCK